MVKNEDYYLGTPNIDKVIFKIVTDDNTQAIQLESGELDMALLDPKNAESFEGKEGFTIHDMTTADYRGILFNFANDYWTENKDIIPAVCYAIDRQAIIDSVLLGQGMPAYGPLQRNIYNDEDVNHYDYDPEKAKEILEVQAVRGVSFSLKAGEVLAIVGESGCGKSVMCKSIMKLLPAAAKIKSGSIRVNGIDITEYKEHDMTKLRGKLFSMVFQDPMTSLNPTMTIGEQIAEAVRIHYPKLSKEEVKDRGLELMTLVGIDHPKERMKFYPYNFSGGMRQRSVMAIALAANPCILFADEPTTALDVTIQAQILDLLRRVQTELGTATVFVTHDLGVVAGVADRVAVMYAGKIVDIGTAEEIFYDPRHPYTKALLSAIPIPDPRRERSRKIEQFVADETNFSGKLTEVSPNHYVLMGE